MDGRQPIVRANGGVWHQKDRDAGTVPHSSIDTEAHWTKSSGHGWKLHLITTIATVWMPFVAERTPANRADSDLAEILLDQVPAAVRYRLSDRHDNRDAVRARCA